MLNNYDEMWEAVQRGEEEDEKTTQPINEADTDQLEYKMTAAVTAYDRKQSTGKSYNKYALSQYLARVGEVIQDIKAGAEPRAAVIAAFHGRLTDAVLKAIGQPTSKTGELPRGLAYKPVVKEAEDFVYEDPEGRDPDEARLEAEGDWEREDAEMDKKLEAANPDLFITDQADAAQKGKIKDAVGNYLDKDYDAMRDIIDEYGDIEFFRHLAFKYLAHDKANLDDVDLVGGILTAYRKQEPSVYSGEGDSEGADVEEATAPMSNPEGLFGVAVGAWTSKDYEKMAQAIDEMGVPEFFTMLQNRLLAKKNQYQGLKMLEAMIQAYRSVREGSDELPANESAVNEMNGYVCHYNGKREEVYAETSLAARDKAAAIWKVSPKKLHMISTTLAEKDVDADTGKGDQVTHTPSESVEVDEAQNEKFTVQVVTKVEYSYLDDDGEYQFEERGDRATSNYNFRTEESALAFQDQVLGLEKPQSTPDAPVEEAYDNVSVGNSPEDQEIGKLFDKLEELRAKGEDKVKGGTYDVILNRLRSLTRERLNKAGVQSTNLRTGKVDTFEGAVDVRSLNRQISTVRGNMEGLDKTDAKYKTLKAKLEKLEARRVAAVHEAKVEESPVDRAMPMGKDDRKLVKSVGTPDNDQVAELSELWRTSRTAAGQDHHKRMQWTADQYSKKNPDKSTIGAYKWLERMLAGVYNGRE